MITSHNRGDWEVRPAPGGNSIYADRLCICRNIDGWGDEEREANGKLMSLAPRMYKLLSAMTEHLEELEGQVIDLGEQPNKLAECYYETIEALKTLDETNVTGMTHPCENCNGEGQHEGQIGGDGYAVADVMLVCMYCKGSGVDSDETLRASASGRRSAGGLVKGPAGAGTQTGGA